MTMTLTGWHFDDDGSPRNGKSVFYRAASNAEPNPNPILAPTTATDVSGRWSLTVPDGDWDCYLLDGPTVRIWKAGTSLPLHFGNAQIMPAADIDLTKLDAGVVDDTGPINAVPTNFQGRLAQIMANIKGIKATVGWDSPVPTNLAIAAAHIANDQGQHGLPPNVQFLGDRTAAGRYVQYGIATTGAEVLYAASPQMYYASVAVLVPVAFLHSIDAVYLTPQRNGIWACVSNVGTPPNGFTAYLNSLYSALVGGQQVSWLAVGH